MRLFDKTVFHFQIPTEDVISYHHAKCFTSPFCVVL